MRFVVVLVTAFLLTGTTAFAGDDDNAPAFAPEAIISSVWATEGDAAHVRFELDSEGRMFGRIVWLQKQNEADFVLVDTENPEESLRSRPLVGMPIMWGFEDRTKGWRRGYIYKPGDGDTYKSKVTQISENEVKVSGCLAFICGGQIWTRMDEAEHMLRAAEQRRRLLLTAR